MSLEQFITKLLNLKESDLQELVSLEKSDESIEFKLKLKPKPTVCPLCGGIVKIHGYYPRKLTHSTFANRKCTILYQQRRYRCEACELTFHEPNPFINSSECLTYETKLNVLKDLKYPEATYTSVARRYNLSVTKVMHLFDTHVSIPRKPLPEVLSMDEHYFPESDYDSLYCCLLMNFQNGEVIDVLPDRRKQYLMQYFSSIKWDTLDYTTQKSELNRVKYISIDLHEPFRDIAAIYFPKALVCADSFHVLEHLTDCFRKVRLNCRNRTENETLQYLLSKFKFVFQHNLNLDNEPKYNRRLGRYLNYRNLRDMMFSFFPELQAAYELKEYYIRLNKTCSIQDAPEAIDKAISIFENAGIEEFEPFYGMLTNWRTEIINSFTTINGIRINNSFIESKNRILEKLLYNGNGFSNFKRTRNRILYCLLYIFFGMCTTLVNIVAYWICAHVFRLKILPSAVIAWYFAVLFAYLTNRKWVFHSEAATRDEILKEIFTFYICRLTTGFIDWALMYVLVDVMLFNDIIIKTFANFLVIVLNFVASKLIIFRKKD